MEKFKINSGEKAYVFFDIDGTLLPEGMRDIPQENIDAIAKLKENGHIPFICTGRCIGQAQNFVDAIGANSFVCSNGQHANVLGEDIYDYHMDNELKKELAAILENHEEVSWGYETKTNIYIAEGKNSEECKMQIQGNGFQNIAVEPFDLSRDVKQMWAFGEKADLDKIQKEIEGKAKTLRWGNQSLEILPITESKAKAIMKILEQATEEVKTYAFGDGLNDIEMLEMVDVGVAMDNAHDDVKKYANVITDDCRENGIANGLERLGLI